MNRGGSWNNNARNCRSANRNRNTPGNRNNNLGFRLASTQTRTRPEPVCSGMGRACLLCPDTCPAPGLCPRTNNPGCRRGR
ncbi:MAG: hypothetical protein H8E19_08765 [Deltaproteobacteria bacterium]|uniref:Sulfatase-modifying factor enzyme domain-containing protein n=1 Tax=Candidatus Desulfacyla euxinica TaxID=2841693 RepID=A0A8J6N0J0_9DELT|nr:hypothetical protein [Candidatus Desulfacyla euxinica]